MIIVFSLNFFHYITDSGDWVEDLATAHEVIQLKMWHSWSGDGRELAPAHESSSAESNNVSFNFTNSITYVFYRSIVRRIKQQTPVV